MKDVADALVAVQVYESHELFGLSVDYIKQELRDLETPIRLACGAYGLLVRAIAKIIMANTPEPEPVQQQSSFALADLKQALGKKEEKIQVHIDVAESLKAVSLEYLPLEVLPSGLLVDKLASEVARLKNKNITKPFVMVDLRDYLPFWCEELGSRSEDASLEASDGEDDQKKNC